MADGFLHPQRKNHKEKGRHSSDSRGVKHGVTPAVARNCKYVQELPAQNSLSCFYVNARSVVNKFDELECYVTELKPDVIFITESWANKYIASAELSLNCYTMYRRD